MPRAESWPRTIVYVEVDAFRTAVHERDDPSLRGLPIAIAGKTRQARVVAVSPAARAQGVADGMPLAAARELVPDLVVTAAQPARYREANRALTAVFRHFASPERMEPIDLGAAYLDVTTRTRHGTTSPEDAVRRLKFMVHDEVGLTASVGASTSKLVARIAGGSRGPDGIVLVRPGEEADFLAPLPLRALGGLGPRTEERLQQLGVRTLGDLAAYDTSRLVALLGSGGGMLQRLSQGRDRSPVETGRGAKTISAEATFPRLVSRRDELEEGLQDLVQRVTERLRIEAVRSRTVYVKLRLQDTRLVSRQVSRGTATDDEAEILASARAALRKSYTEGMPVKLLGVGLSGLEHPHPDHQLTLFD
ncbi:MAG: DNA polymerase IV [Candidatus Dormiibacterota bacterium]